MHDCTACNNMFIKPRQTQEHSNMQITFDISRENLGQNNHSTIFTIEFLSVAAPTMGHRSASFLKLPDV